MCRCCNWGLLPLFTGLLMGIGILTTYAIAAGTGHVDPLLPSISDTGIENPECHIFSQVLNVVAAMSVLTFVLRYKMIRAILSDDEIIQMRILSIITLVIGIVASIGLSIVGNFQDDTAAMAHYVGAFLVFILGNTYCILDAAITRKMSPKYHGQKIFWVRLLIGIAGFSALISTLVAHAIASRQIDYDDKEQRLHWKPDDGGYPAHLAASFSEWIMGFMFIIYFFTYVRDFKDISVELKVNMLIVHLNESSEYSQLTHSQNGSQASQNSTERTPLLT